MQLSKVVLLLCLLIVAILIQGCAVGNRYNLSDIREDLQAAPSKTKNVAIVTSDQRTVIVSGECAPTYIGMQRGGFGNPFRVDTESDLPLADDLTKSVSESLSKKGYIPRPVFIKFTDDRGQILESLKRQKADRSLVFIINKWESDTFINIGLDYDIELTVYNAELEKIASASIAEHKDIPGSFWNPPAAAREEVPLAFKKVLETLLNDPKILPALQ